MSAHVPESSGHQVRPFSRRIGRSIPDPVVIFIVLYLVCSLSSWGLSGFKFSWPEVDGVITEHTVRNMLSDHGLRWMFDNALLQNWLAFGNGALGMMLVVILGVGVAQESGLLTALVRYAARRVSSRFLPWLSNRTWYVEQYCW